MALQRHGIPALIVALTLTSAHWLLAAAASTQAPQGRGSVLRLDPFEENYVDEVAVSGRLVVGLQISESGKTSRPLTPLLVLPDESHNATSSICLLTTTRDGRYASKGLIKPAAIRESRSPRTVLFDSRYKDKLQADASYTLAFLAIEGDCDRADRAEARLFVVDVRGQASPSGTHDAAELELLINSGRLPTEVEYETNTGQATRHQCVAIQDGARRAFDAKCSLKDLKRQPGETLVWLQQRRFERMLDKKRVRVVWGP